MRSYSKFHRMFMFLSVFLLAPVGIRAEILPLWSSSLLDDISDETVPLRYLGPTPRLVSNCEGTAQIYLSEYAYLSQNAFVTPMAPMRIPANLLHVDDPVVQTAVIRSESIALLIDGTVFIYNLQTGEYQEVIIPADYTVTSLEFSQYCCIHTWCEDWSDAVFAIGKPNVPGDGSIIIFVIERGQIEPEGTPIPHDLQDHELLAAVPILPWHSVALLLLTENQEDHTQEALFYYLHVPFEGRNPERDEDHTELTMKAIVYSHHGDNLNIVHLKNKFGEFLMWGPKELFISKTAGQSVFRASEELIEHLEDDHDEYIQELIPGANGDFAFLTSEGRLFYGRSNLETHMVELHADDLVDSHSAISFDKQSNIFIMNAQHYDMDSHDASTDSLVYLASELIYPSEVLEEQDHDLPSCPFLLFTADFGSELYYIDIGHSLTLRASYIPDLWQNSNIMIYASNPGIITANTSLTTADPIGHGLEKIEVKASLTLTGDREDMEHGEYIHGLTTVTFTTAEPSLTCLPNPSIHAYVSADCPPEKTIKIRKQVKRDSCEYLKNYVYTFERDEYDPSFMEGTEGIDEDQGSIAERVAFKRRDEYDPSFMEGTDGIDEDQETLSIQYDYGRHGCPDRSYYSDGYKPQFDLYMGDEFIEKMDTDYAMIEIHGVHNYQYSMTAQQAGCKQQPQSWVDMLRLQNTSRDPNTAWTRVNYHNCLEGNETEIAERAPYQVLSYQSQNMVLWRQKNAIYVFNVTVLDPKYSYCSLQTQFALEVYGALPKSAVSAIKVMLITCALGFAGVAFIFIYYIVQQKEAEEEQQTQKIPQFPH